MRQLQFLCVCLATFLVSELAIAAPPAQPQNVRASATSPTAALIQWNAAPGSDGRVLYAITRNRASLGVRPGNSFQDNGLLPARTFEYTIATVNIDGERSAPSTISVTTPPLPQSNASAPAAANADVATPTGFRLERYSSKSLELFWNRVDGEYLRYEVLQNGKTVRTTDGTSHFVRLSNPDAPQIFQLIAKNASGQSSRAAIVSINVESPPTLAPSTPATPGTALANPENVTLKVYSKTSAELFWLRKSNGKPGIIEVEVSRDGRYLGKTNGTSFYDNTRSDQNHVYTLVATQSGVRSSGIKIPQQQSNPAPTTNPAQPIGPVYPQLSRLPVTGNGTDIFLLNGQSNANPQFLAAMTEHLSEKGFDFTTGHFFVGGQPLSTWIEEDGTKGFRWPIMMNVFDGVTDVCTSNPESIRSITLVHYQGEADVNTTEMIIAVQNGTDTPFKKRLNAFVTEFTRHFEQRCSITPNISLAIISFIQGHPLFPARLSDAHALVRKNIADVAQNHANVGAFDTIDLGHADHVHLELHPSTSAQRTAAERAISLFYR